MSLIIAVFVAIASLVAGNLLWFNLSNDGLLSGLSATSSACLFVCCSAWQRSLLPNITDLTDNPLF